MIFAIIVGTVSLLIALIGIFVFQVNIRDRRNILFFLACMSISAWMGLFSLLHIVPSEQLLFLSRVITAPILFAPGFLLIFIQNFPKNSKNSILKSLIIHAFFIAFFLSFLFSDDYISHSEVIGGKHRFTSGWAYAAAQTYVVGCAIICAITILRKMKTLKGDAKFQLKLINIGLLLCVVFGSFFAVILPILGHSEYNTIAPIGTLCLVFFLAVSILKYQFMDVRLIITKSIATFILVLMVIFSAFLSHVFLSSFLHVPSVVQLIILSILWTFAGHPLHHFLITTAKQAFVKGWYNFEETSKKIAHLLSKSTSIDTALINVKLYLENTLEFDTLTLYLKDGYFINKSLTGTLVGVEIQSDTQLLAPQQVSDTSIFIDKTTHSSKNTFIELKGFKKHHLPPELKKATAILPIYINAHQPLAAIVIQKKLGGLPVTPSDFNLLSSIQNQLSTLFHFHTAATKAAQLSSAKLIQSKLITSSPQISNYDIATHFSPSSTIGGDYLTVMPLPNNGTRLILADVVSHGLEAGIGTFILSSILKTLIPDHTCPADIKTLNHKVNDVLMRFNDDNDLDISLSMVIMDISDSGDIRFCGSHDPLLFYRAASKHIEAIPIDSFSSRHGMFHSTLDAISEQVISLQKDDILFLYTDGLSEAIRMPNHGTETMFGIERIKTYLKRHANKAPEIIRSGLVNDHKKWTNGIYEDDVCMVVIKKIV